MHSANLDMLDETDPAVDTGTSTDGLDLKSAVLRRGGVRLDESQG